MQDGETLLMYFWAFDGGGGDEEKITAGVHRI